MINIQNNLEQNDKEIFDLVKLEEQRQQTTLSMIPSENYTSLAVREALGSVLVHKYSEGQVGKRYYEGNEYIDQIEQIAKDRASSLFKLPINWRVNVQAHSGSLANLAVLTGLLNPSDRVMSMYLPDGGHLSHGWKLENGTPISFASRIFDINLYRVDKQTEVFDYDAIEKQAIEFEPQLIIAGGTSYPQLIDHERMAAIAHKVGGYYLADIAHESGLIAAGVNPSPIGIADVVTMTTHKTIRGPKGALILGKMELMSKIDSAVFPGLQGGPFNNNIAGIAVCLKEAQSDEFKNYANQVIVNAKYLARLLGDFGYSIVSGGTAKHLVLINLINQNITGKVAARALAYGGIICNKNTIPFETKSPFNPSGIRMGTPTITTRGMKEEQIKLIASFIHTILQDIKNVDTQEMNFDEINKLLSENSTIQQIKNEVKNLCAQFPL